MKNEVNKECTALPERVGQLQDALKEPPLYRIVVHNDDFTPMEFVISLLERLFYLDRRTATNIMLEAHLKGQAAFGSYTKEVAESKLSEVVQHARAHDYPLICSMEAASS